MNERSIHSRTNDRRIVVRPRYPVRTCGILYVLYVHTTPLQAHETVSDRKKQTRANFLRNDMLALTARARPCLSQRRLFLVRQDFRKNEGGHYHKILSFRQLARKNMTTNQDRSHTQRLGYRCGHGYSESQNFISHFLCIKSLAHLLRVQMVAGSR
jgi:hypothetical protein